MVPEDFLQLGIELIERGTPASARTGVSRLYYANHLQAIIRGTSIWGYVPAESADDHGGLIRYMLHRKGRFLGPATRLSSLRTARNHADYHLSAQRCDYCNNPSDLEFSPEELNALIADAKALFRSLSSL